MKYKKKEDDIKEKIIMELPSFINELLLFLSSGMVLNEALVVIAKEYQKHKTENNVFADEFCKIYYDSQKARRSFVYMFNAYGKRSQIKELSKLTNILEDGEKKGINLTEKLSELSKNLWEDRKKKSMEKIRMAETKMSFPLGLLLIALIIITAAPAMMQM